MTKSETSSRFEPIVRQIYPQSIFIIAENAGEVDFIVWFLLKMSALFSKSVRELGSHLLSCLQSLGLFESSDDLEKIEPRD